jgi:hypothetical protein
MARILFAILAVLCVAALALSILFSPSDTSWSYWLTIGWLLILIIGNWFTSAALFSESRKHENTGAASFSGILPGAGIVIFVYSILSAAGVLFFNLGFISPRFHLGAQILILATAAIVTLSMMLAARAAGDGNAPSVSRRELLHSARRIRIAVSAEERTEVDRFIEFIEYQMAHPASLDQEKLKSSFRFLQDKRLEHMERIRRADDILRSD